MNHKENVYLVPKEDDTWTTVVADTLPAPDAAVLCGEGSYPVHVYYSRTDLNGSSSVERDTCQNREELIQSLNWIGQCGYLPLSLWEHHAEKRMETELVSILNKAYDRGDRLRSQELADIEDGFERKPLQVLIEQAENMVASADGPKPPERAPEK